MYFNKESLKRNVYSNEIANRKTTIDRVIYSCLCSEITLPASNFLNFRASASSIIEPMKNVSTRVKRAGDCAGSVEFSTVK